MWCRKGADMQRGQIIRGNVLNSVACVMKSSSIGTPLTSALLLSEFSRSCDGGPRPIQVRVVQNGGVEAGVGRCSRMITSHLTTPTLTGVNFFYLFVPAPSRPNLVLCCSALARDSPYSLVRGMTSRCSCRILSKWQNVTVICNRTPNAEFKRLSTFVFISLQSL